MQGKRHGFFCKSCVAGVHDHDDLCHNTWTDSTCDCTHNRTYQSNREAAIAKSLDYCMWIPLTYENMWKTQVERFLEHLQGMGYDVVKQSPIAGSYWWCSQHNLDARSIEDDKLHRPWKYDHEKAFYELG